jgi:hypothetical protein
MDEKQRRMLHALADKYRVMHELRARVGQHARQPPRDCLRALAQRFPGALRELDELPLATIETRLFAIVRVLELGSAPERWMILQSAYHGRLRAVLRIKQSLRCCGPADDPLADYLQADDEPAATRFDQVALRLIARPPGGRLNRWVFEQVAAEHGTTPDEVHAALFLR